MRDLYVVFAAYVRISLKFWSLQPVFHIYNLLYWIRPPGLIHPELPEINKVRKPIQHQDAKCLQKYRKRKKS